MFEEKREVELVWNGKGSEVGNIVQPVQVIEQVDERRAEKPAQSVLFDARGGQLKGGANKLIRGAGSERINNKMSREGHRRSCTGPSGTPRFPSFLFLASWRSIEPGTPMR